MSGLQIPKMRSQSVDFSISDELLAWKLQISEYLSLYSKRFKDLTRVSFSQDMIVSKMDDTVYKVRRVTGDRNCFFHAVNNSSINRNALVHQLLTSSSNKAVRRGFALEIRQFLYIGIVSKHQDIREKEACKKLLSKSFKNLISQQTQYEEDLRVQLQIVLQTCTQAEGKTPEQLLSFFHGNHDPEIAKFREIYGQILSLDQQIAQDCSSENLFKNYVKSYLKDAEGFIPFSRRLPGEEVETPIDVINFLFKTNIQIFLNTGERLTCGGNSATIPILHNGLDHFDGLTRKDNEPLLEVDQLVSQMSLAEKPSVYQMDHLLQAGFLGTHYQFLVLLNEMTKLMTEGCSFRARFEAKGYGNLDDVIIRYKNMSGQEMTRAFQIKYYVESIQAAHFVNKNQRSKKNAKMHIGKFLEGWLAFRKKRFPNQESIIYSNTGVDSVLNSCITRDRFSRNFVEGNQSVQFTVKRGQQQDFYSLLFNQAQDYLGECLTQDVFQEFLGSFRFYLHQKDLEPLIESTIEHLKQIRKEWVGIVQFDQLFINLLYGVQEWFTHDHSARTPPELTDKVLERLFKKSQVHFHQSIELQTITKTTLEHVEKNQIPKVPRTEKAQFEKALENQGLIVVIGEKGMGKSVFVKNGLEACKPSRFLFLSTAGLISDKFLKEKSLEVLQHEKNIFALVLDGAEALLLLSIERRRAFIEAFLSRTCRVILTLTPDAFPQLAIEPTTMIPLKSLSIKDVLKTFPQLTGYVEKNPKLFCTPFYLNIMLQLFNQLNRNALNQVIDRHSTSLEMKLIRQMVSGVILERQKDRKKRWMEISALLASGNEKISATQIDPSLEFDGIVIDAQSKPRFSHDLFFEYGLIAFWVKTKDVYDLLQKPLEFWKTLPSYLKFTNPISVLVKWYAMRNNALKQEIISLAPQLSKMDVFDSLIALAIVMHDRDLLNELLKYIKNDSTTSYIHSDIILAITVDSPSALTALLESKKRVIAPIISIASESKSEPSQSSEESHSSSDEEKSSSKNSETSSEDGYDLFSHTEDSHSSDSDCLQGFCQPEEGPSIYENFCKHKGKYWCAGFDEEHGWTDDEGEWIENPRYEVPPDHSSLPLHQAVLMNRIKCLKVLIPYRSFWEDVNNYNESPLHLAILESLDTVIIEELVEMPSYINARDAWGETPLHNAAYKDNFDAAEILLRQGADPKALSEQGLSPLHIAMTRLNLSLVKIFLQYKGDLSVNPFDSEEIMVADLLDNIDSTLQDEMETFVIDLINYIDLGPAEDSSDPNWDRSVVEDLMTLVEHRAQLSEHFPGFDYIDSDSEIDYMLEQDPTKIDELASSIIDNPECIDHVLSSDMFENQKIDLLDSWLEIANNEQFENIRAYVEECDDPKVKEWLKNILSDIEEI